MIEKKIEQDEASRIEFEKFFIELTEELFSEDELWFGNSLAHSLFTPALTLYLMMLQVLYKGSLSDALSFVHDGLADQIISRNVKSKKAKERTISSSTGAYAQARARLKPAVISELIEALINKTYGKESNIPAVLIDGTNLTLTKTEDIELKYIPHSNKKKCLPLMRVVFATDIHTGIGGSPSFGSAKKSEQELSIDVIKELEAGTTVIGDRNFGVFSVVSSCHLRELPVLFRLTDARAKKVLGRSVPKRGEFEVTWERTRHDKLYEENTAESIKGRIITRVIQRDGFEPINLVLFTTSKLSASELVELYAKRHNIELDIRQLKVTLQADHISAKTTDMVEKELLVRFAAYNLVRCIIAEAGKAVGLTPRELSFTGMLRYIKVLGLSAGRATNLAEREKIWERFLTIARQQKLPKRKEPRPTYPRKVRRNNRKFPINGE